MFAISKYFERVWAGKCKRQSVIIEIRKAVKQMAGVFRGLLFRSMGRQIAISQQGGYEGHEAG